MAGVELAPCGAIRSYCFFSTVGVIVFAGKYFHFSSSGLLLGPEIPSTCLGYAGDQVTMRCLA